MDRLFTLAGAFALSFLAALAAASQLLIHIGFGDHIPLVAVPVAAATLGALAVFGVAEARARDTGVLRNVAIALALAALALVLVTFPVVVEQIELRSDNPYNILGPRDPRIAVMLLIAILLAILVQWRMVRRSFLRTRHPQAEHRTAWPWITTIAACVLVLNPAGLAILEAAIVQSPTDWLRGLWTVVSLGAAAALALGGWIEWRMRSRRLAAGVPAAR